MADDESLKNASIGFFAYDLDSGTIIAELNGNKSLVPASTLKLVTTASAIELLGAKKQFNTTIQYSGIIDSNGILEGNIYIIGSGDPCLGAKRYKAHYGDFINKWALAIQKLGIDSINGSIIGDASIFNYKSVPDTWIWGDLGNYFGATASGLSIYENKYEITLKSGNPGEITEVIKIKPSIPDLKFENLVLSKNTRKDEAYIYGAPHQYNRIIRGAIPANRSQFVIKGSIPDPTFLAAYKLDTALSVLGIGISTNPSTVKLSSTKRPKQLTSVTTTKSPQLSSIIKKTNMHSINLYAEHFINLIALTKDSLGSTQKGTEEIISFWKSKGMDVNGFFMEDGSGLSRFNGITAKQLVYILQYMNRSKNITYFKSSLPVAGKSGTLRSLGKNTVATNNINAKSGYMTRVRSYSGYVKTKNNKNIAFALIVNNYNCTAYQMKKKMELIMVKLAEIDE